MKRIMIDEKSERRRAPVVKQHYYTDSERSAEVIEYDFKVKLKHDAAFLDLVCRYLLAKVIAKDKEASCETE